MPPCFEPPSGSAPLLHTLADDACALPCAAPAMDFKVWQRGVVQPDSSATSASDLDDSDRSTVQERAASMAVKQPATKSNGVATGTYRNPPRKTVIPDSDDEEDSPQEADTTGGSSIVLVSESQASNKQKAAIGQANGLVAKSAAPQPKKPNVNAPRPASSKVIEILDSPPHASYTSSSNANRSHQVTAANNSAKVRVNKLPDFKRNIPQSGSSASAYSSIGKQEKLSSPLNAAASTFKPRPNIPQRAQTPVYDISSASSASLPDQPWRTGPSIPSPSQQRYKYGQVKQESARAMTAKERITAEFNAENKRVGIPIGKPTDPSRNMPGWSQRACAHQSQYQADL